MKLIVLIRHLPTYDDIRSIYTPNDSEVEFTPLDHSRLEQAQVQLKNFVRETGIHQIFSSNNNRGISTAKLYVEKYLASINLVVDDRLNNIQQPEWANQSQGIVSKSDKYKKWRTNPSEVIFEGGDSLLTISDRLDSFLSGINSKGAVIFSHTATLQVILCKLLKIEIGKIWCFKFDAYKFSVAGNGILISNNSYSLDDLNLEELRG